MVMIDMPMPTNCESCNLMYYDSDFDREVCPFVEESVEGIKRVGRLSNCPLIEVSKELKTW